MTATPADTLREAAAERRAKSVPLDEPPSGQARQVCTGWMRGARHARDGSVRTEPTRVRAKKVPKDDKEFFVVEGYFTVYERGYEMWDWAGPYTEVVSAGAAEQTIAANADVVFLENHRGLALARTVPGTLELWSDDVGGGDRAWLNPMRDDVRRLVTAIEDGTITEQSFAFMIASGQWSPDYTEYRINVVDMDRGDTSAVNYGANPFTSIAARAREIMEALDRMPPTFARMALDRLTARNDITPAQARSAAPVNTSVTVADQAAAIIEEATAAAGGMSILEAQAMLARMEAGWA